ncbi:MAG: zinc ribbon domain-containing protein [Polaromonas sp.]|uniref:FmdB family zinc ribbon protein n=1 Tax=Polaromonas sp. TaxID=1869339 RepID=UPI00183D3CED|nr:FmdB family zinc ribbon protein [Polaromonas sp.]NMM10688.1 zinc ribbon domain-containing protein [Polaromonas sp.]
MPIYAYKCESCGYAKDTLQKMSDAPLTVCPQCGKPSFKKQVTAAGFQLKGSGWYVTDFRGGNSGAQSSKSADSEPPGTAAGDGKAADASAASTPAGTPVAATPAAAPVAPASKAANGESSSKA